MVKLELISNNPKTFNDKPPLLFIHGMWHGAWCWEPFFLPYFEKKGVKAYAVSLSNHANSGKRKAFNLLRIKDYVDDIKQIIDSLDQKPILVGHSMGGYVVQKYLEENNDTLGAVLMASVPPFGIWDGTMSVMKKFTGAFLKANITLNLKYIVNTKHKYKHMLCSEKFDEKDVDEYVEKIDTESFLAYIDMLGLNLVKSKKINTPLLVMGGGKDSALSTNALKKTAKRYNTDAIIFKDIPHMMMLDPEYAKVADKILEWLETLYITT